MKIIMKLDEFLQCLECASYMYIYLIRLRHILIDVITITTEMNTNALVTVTIVDREVLIKHNMTLQHIPQQRK